MGFRRRFFGVALSAAASVACAAAIEVAVLAPAEAQFFGNDTRQNYRQRPQRQQGGGFFDGLFGRPRGPVYQEPPIERAPPQQQREVDSSRAPAPRKSDGAAHTTSVVVMGDAMADWLAYGLEEAFGDAPEIGIIRKNKLYSGLLRYDAKTDQDWWQVARELLATEKPNYVVMMLGVSDRQNIRERDLPKTPDKKEAEAPAAAAGAAPAGDTATEGADDEAPTIAAPEPAPPQRSAGGVIEFRTDRWASIYSRRIDDTIAALKSKGVPVFWVGLPSIRGTRSTADAVYLNDLYRARAQRAGAIYIDVWDGFVDEGGRFTTFGPDFEGQRRRLRSGDGVFFSAAGARKLAHYVERELRRHMSNRVPVALPAGPVGPLPEGQSAVRPLAGPVVPLTTPVNADGLLGGAGSRPALIDATATRVLVKGQTIEAPVGRADDFVWPPGSARVSDPAIPAAAAAASASVPAVAPPAATSYTEPPAAAGKPADTKANAKADPKAAAKGKPAAPAPRAAEPAPRPQAAAPAQRPPQPVRPSGGLLDMFR